MLSSQEKPLERCKKRQKEILRYLGFLKTEESMKRNVEKVIQFLAGKKVGGVLFS